MYVYYFKCIQIARELHTYMCYALTYVLQKLMSYLRTLNDIDTYIP